VTIDVATLLTVGWRTAADSGDLHYFSLVVVVVVFAVLVRTVMVEIRSNGRPVLILGSGPMAAKLIEEIDSAVDARYVVAGIVDDERPRPTAAVIFRFNRCSSRGSAA
jgi:FlaA1/EpsC-like NDP-sugar epimerase